ncbi:MAG: hypothetical protein U0996_16710 [Planctomycetaceae bacterium]
MIRNARQYRITKAQSLKFEEALDSLRSRHGGDPLLLQLEGDALECQLDELRGQIEEYESFRSGTKQQGRG